MNALISIIIPNFNRATLIGETLDSIKAQTYQNWECIIVDDNSTDESVAVIKNYIHGDTRFKLIIRPQDYPKGANSCRNIGMSNAEGDYVIYFDSDDLMVENHISRKVEALQSGDYDFVIARTEYFNNPKNINPMSYRELGKLPINADHFITKKLSWLTPDPIIKSEIAKSLFFTEKKESAEEYNYFVKLTLKTEKAISIDDILTLRRFHEGSYQVNLKTQKEINHNQFHYYYDTYTEVKNYKISKNSLKHLLSAASNVFYRDMTLLSKLEKRTFYMELIKTFGILKGLNKIRIIERKS